MKKFNKTAVTILLFALILLSFSCDKDVSVSPPDEPVHTGSIYMDSNPKGASIYLNGKNTGNHTPDSLKWLNGTDYTVTLKYPLFRDTTFTVSVDEKVKKEIFVDYFQNPSMYGKIDCQSDPENAEIYLDGQKNSKATPDILESIVPGSHMLRYHYPGCRDDSINIIVESGKTKLAYIKLKDTTVWVTYNSSNSGIPGNALSAILVDQNDVKWIGTLGQGVVRFDGINWQSYNTGNSPLPNDFITAMVLDYENHIWIGTNKGLAELYGGSWRVYNTDNSMLPDNYITSICVGKNNVIWVGTDKGLIRMERSKWTLYNSSNSGLQNNTIQRLATEFSGTLWLGVQSVGLMTFDGVTWKTYSKENTGLPGRNVTALAVGQYFEGIWAGFVSNVPRGSDEGGLAVKESGLWYTDYYSKLPSRIINSIMIKNNTKWVCTDGGLVKFNTASIWEVLNTSNTQLPTNIINSVSQDSRGYLWIASGDAGLVKYKIK